MTNSKPKRAAIYARVSTDDQHCENQLAELRQIAKRAGWEIAAEYVDDGISGANGRDKRPALDRLCKDAMRRKFNVVMIWALDRLGRNTAHLAQLAEEFKARGVDLFSAHDAIDTTTPAGKLQYDVLSAIAEFERARLQERIKAGLDRAKTAIDAKGMHRAKSGRAITRLGHPGIGADKERQILAARREGKGTRTIAKEVGCARGTVIRVLREHGDQ